MKTARIQTRCECQARLSAILDESTLVVAGSVKTRNGETEMAPANTIGAGGELFQVGWQCPLCLRNIVRSFYRGALSYVGASGDAPKKAG